MDDYLILSQRASGTWVNDLKQTDSLLMARSPDAVRWVYQTLKNLMRVSLTGSYSCMARSNSFFNPFTAPACKISGLKIGQTRLLSDSICSSPITNLILILRLLMKSFHVLMQKKKTRRLHDLKFRTFIGCLLVTLWQ